MTLKVGQVVTATRNCSQGLFEIGDNLRVTGINNNGDIFVKNLTRPKRTHKNLGYALSDEYTTKSGDDVKMTEVCVGAKITATVNDDSEALYVKNDILTVVFVFDDKVWANNETRPERTEYEYAELSHDKYILGEQTTSTSTESEKVVLTAAQARSLQAALEHHNFNREVLVEYHCKTSIDWEDRFKHLNDVKLDTVIRALYIGFDVEKTPEQEIAEYYSNLSDVHPQGHGEMQGIRYVLGKLNIKIPGVNLPI